MTAPASQSLVRGASLLASSVAGVLLSAQAQAAHWLLTPTTRVDAAYNDNPRLVPEDAVASGSATGDVLLTLQRYGERSDLTLRPRVRSTRYESDPALDSDYRYFDIVYGHRAERLDWSATAGYVRDTTLTSELETTGIVQIDRAHESINLSAGPTWRMSERTTVVTQVDWTDNRYEGGRSAGLSDYRYGSLFALFSSSVTERSALTLLARAGQLGVPRVQDSTREDAMLRIGWRYQPSPAWSLDLSAGPSITRSDTATEDGTAYVASVRREAPMWTFSTSAQREVRPTGRGLLTRREQVSLELTRRVDEQVWLSVAARALRNEDLLPSLGLTAEEVEYGRIDMRMSWALAQNWRLSLDFGAATQERASRPGTAESFQVGMGVVWNGQAHSL